MKVGVFFALLATLLSLQLASAADKLLSTSLDTCIKNSGFQATLFNVTFTPADGLLRITIKAESSIMGFVKARLSVVAYGFNVMEQELDPCKTKGLEGMCPMSQEPFNLSFQQPVDPGTIKQIPKIAYRIPDLDGKARLEVIDESGKTVACVEAPLSNGQTVDQAGVSWVTAIISGVAILASAVVAGLGYSNAGAHLAANALSLFGYFQAMAMVSMVAVPLPPLVAAWTQNFAWSMGIINLGFMQTIFHWYIQATGGAPASLFRQAQDVSVQIAKRSMPRTRVRAYLESRAAHYGFIEFPELAKRAVGALASRSNNAAVVDPSKIVMVTGIERMSYKAHIEATNYFMTGMSFYVVFICLVILLVGGFRILCKLPAIKRNGGFREFRAEWLVVLKGIMYRVVLIGFPQMCIICPWEWTHHDSPAAVVLATFFFLSLTSTLLFATYKILTVARHSSRLNNTLGASYTLYSDPYTLNRWGYLYVPFRHTRFFWIAPLLVYYTIKCLTLAFAQTAGNAQVIIIMILELAYLGVISYFRPYLDKRTNIVAIGIAAVAFLNGIFVFLFSDVTGAPEVVAGVLGVVFFIVNAVFALVLLVMVLVSTGFALFSRDPEKPYVTVAGVSPALGEKLGSGPVTVSRDLDGEETGNEIPAEGAATVGERRSLSLHDAPPPRSVSRRSERSGMTERNLRPSLRAGSSRSLRDAGGLGMTVEDVERGRQGSVRSLEGSVGSRWGEYDAPPISSGAGSGRAEAMRWDVGVGYERYDR